MNATLPGHCLKDLSKVLVCLSRISDDIGLEAAQTKFVLSALNSSKSAFGSVELQGARMFSQYECLTRDGLPLNTPNRESASVHCRIQVKALLAVFKPKNLGEARQDKETAVEKCELKFRNSVAGDGQCRLIIQLHCKHGILKTYQLTYEDEQSMHAVFDPRKCQNRWVISAKLLKDYMDHFIAKTEELAMSAAQSKLILTAFTEGLTYNTETLKQAVHTVISLDTSEFQTYDISRELSAEIVFSLRDFKSIITLAESFSVDVQTGYGQPGHPLIITFQIGGMDAQFMIATISENGSTQPSTIQTANTTNTTHLPPSSSASGPKRRRRVNGSSSQRPSSTHPPPPSLERQASLTSAINSIPIRDNNGYGDNDDLGQIEWDTRQSGDDANHDSSVGHQPPVPDADIVYINPNEEGEELLPTQHRTQVRGLFDRDL